jgi:hypothetical protein
MADLEQAVNVPKGIGGSVGGIFSRKYAGVPAWVILLVVAGGAYLYIRSRGSYSPVGSSASSGADNGSDAGGDLGSESGYQASGQPQIVFVPAGFGSTTDPNHPTHPAGPGGKGRNSGNPTHFTGRGARGTGRGFHGKPPKATGGKPPVRKG